MSKKVLIVGFDPHKIAFGPERGLTSEGVAATGQATTDKLSGLWLERKRSCQLAWCTVRRCRMGEVRFQSPRIT